MDGHLNKIVDICLSQSDRAKNKQRLAQIERDLTRLQYEKEDIESENKRLIETERESKFELMLLLSHRRFCRLMGIKP